MQPNPKAPALNSREAEKHFSRERYLINPCSQHDSKERGFSKHQKGKKLLSGPKWKRLRSEENALTFFDVFSSSTDLFDLKNTLKQSVLLLPFICSSSSVNNISHGYLIPCLTVTLHSAGECILTDTGFEHAIRFDQWDTV